MGESRVSLRRRRVAREVFPAQWFSDRGIVEERLPERGKMEDGRFRRRVDRCPRLWVSPTPSCVISGWADMNGALPRACCWVGNGESEDWLVVGWFGAGCLVGFPSCLPEDEYQALEYGCPGGVCVAKTRSEEMESPETVLRWMLDTKDCTDGRGGWEK